MLRGLALLFLGVSNSFGFLFLWEGEGNGKGAKGQRGNGGKDSLGGRILQLGRDAPPVQYPRRNALNLRRANWLALERPQVVAVLVRPRVLFGGAGPGALPHVVVAGEQVEDGEGGSERRDDDENEVLSPRHCRFRL